MDSALSISTTTSTTLFAVSKALNRRLSTSTAIQCVPARLLSRRLSCICGFYVGLNGGAARLASFSSSSSSSPSSSLRTLCAVEASLRRRRLQCVSSSAASSFASGGGNGGFGGESGGGDGGGGGGENGSDGGSAKSKLVAGAGDEASALSSEVIILDVGGMTCGGCAASVKRILESQPQVSSATVNLTTETAIVWPLSEAKVVPNWHQQLGETLAKHLTSCGFTSSLRVAGEDATEGDISP